jgi:hypothetical protein
MWGQCGCCTSSTRAPAGAVFGGVMFAGAVHPAKRTLEFLRHGVEGELERGPPSDQHVIVAGAKRRRRRKPDELAQPAPHPIAFNGVADLFADGETDPRRPALRPRPCLQNKGAGMRSRALLRPLPGSLGNGPKVTPAFQPLHRSDFGVTSSRRPFAIEITSVGCRVQALSRLRPCARRAASTLRPPLLAIRARKPWRRLRTSLLG